MDKEKGKAKWLLPLSLIVFLPVSATAQRFLTLDSCRAMSLRNNKQLGISKVKQDVAQNVRKAARTKYLPHVSAVGAYLHTDKEVSLLNNDQKSTLENLGAGVSNLLPAADYVSEKIGAVGSLLTKMGLPTDALEQLAGQVQSLSSGAGAIGSKLNQFGRDVEDAFRTDTRNIWAGSVLFVQPVFMGGSIIALNKMADLSEQLAANSTEAKLQATLYATDQAYWQVVSLKHKQRLAQSYLDVVKKLSSDVHKMIDEGVATRSDGLSVDVKVNEAEMTLTKVTDGVVLSKMLLCQTIGLPIDEQVTLADEDTEQLSVDILDNRADIATAEENRPELKMLGNMVSLSRQATNVLKAANLPQVLLTGGYTVSNPSVLNGFEKKFRGLWNVGVMVRVPIWNWGDNMYKVRASKGATAIATLEMEEAREKIGLQVTQVAYKVDEAGKRLKMAQTNIERANENLRTANLGFKEGVITPTTVMEAQTAWLQAESQRIDAEIELRLSQVDLKKALGRLNIEN